ncbi:helix-turn-helix domain-containing protein [Lederbergia panacisoli]|uniref:helix-turn-helix domain-containing protein n=1 Tax=Lederbergia panacisoli TaxID=1255251 RepID=UPI00214CD2ED|nr:helix-turn-helix domain-containing protein [Lederbergia panacisoli]MCR2822061.1 AraC family transcriptional regulator [Lederbergia panacisoli]
MDKLITVKGFMRIFSVLLLIVLIMFVTNYLLMKNSTQRLYEQMKENNRLIVSGIIQSIDDTFKDINNLIYSIDTLPYNPSDNQEVDYTNYLLYKDMHKLITLSSSHDYIEEVVVFFDQSDLAITSKGTIDLNEFFNEQYKNKRNNAMFWTSFFSDEKPLEIFPAKTYMKKVSGDNYRSKNLITIAGNTQFSSKNIIVFLDVDAMLEIIDQKTMMDETSFLILDQNNNIVLTTEEKINLGEVVRGLYVDEGEQTILKNQIYEYVVYKSDYNGFTYINRIPIQYTTVASITDDQQTIILISGIITLLLLFVLSLYLFRPMKKVSSIIGGEPNWKSIYRSILHLKQDIIKYKNIEKTLQSELNRHIFIKAMSEGNSKNENYLPLKGYFSNILKDRQFILLKFGFDRKSTNDVEDCKEFIERGLKEELHYRTVFLRNDIEFLILIGIDQASERKYVIQSIQKLMERAQISMKGDIYAIISKPYDSRIDHLRTAFQDITYTSLYRNVGIDSMLYDAETIQHTIQIYFPVEKIEKLPNLIVSGKENDAIHIINDIIKENVDMNIQRHQFLAILQSLLLYMKRHLQLNKDDQHQLYTLEMNFDSNMRESQNLEELKLSFMKIVKFVIEKGTQTKKQESKLNPVFIAQYIELHYMDNLYLEHMAKITETSSKYFSKYFKNAFGVNFVEYLHRVRINYAKEHLKNENTTIAEIGEKVGYLNATTFASTFKKYTGLSPTKYREKIINQDFNYKHNSIQIKRTGETK